MNRLRYAGLVLVAALVTFAISGCGSDAQPSSDTTQDTGSAQIDPQTPVDKADETVDDANAVTDEQTGEIQELTDSD